MRRHSFIELCALIISLLTLVLMYNRFLHDKSHARKEQRLLDLQIELHKEQIDDLKEKNIADNGF